MEQNAKEFKKTFFETIAKYHLPTQNKSILFYTLAGCVESQPENKELYELLITSICDNGFLLDKFAVAKTLEEEAEDYRQLRTRIEKYYHAVESEQQLKDLWKQVTSRKTLPSLKNIPHGLQEECQAEVDYLCRLYRKFFPVTEQNSPELKNNLCTYVMITKGYPDYRMIAPFFFYQIMVKHTSRFAVNSDFHLSPKTLWNYRKYEISVDNEKNYKQYETLGKLFKKLCKYYKTDVNVNIQLCRYGFCHSSNLIEWLNHFKPQKVHKFKTPLAQFYDNLDLTHWENYEPEKYDMYSVYKISREDFFHYSYEYAEELLQVENYLMEYFQEHTEYLIICMEHMYVDMKVLQNTLKEIYENANLKSIYPTSLPLGFQLAAVYDVLTQCLDMAVKAKVENVLFH